jgi:hypothetical protein
LQKSYFMKQPHSLTPTSYPFNTPFCPRVAQPTVLLVHLEDEEATRMPTRMNSDRFRNKRIVLQLGCVPVLLVLLLFAAASYAQTAAHSPGWVVLPVEDYRALHARAFPTERDPEPPPVEATLTRVDYEIRINGDLASGRATLTVDVLKDGWVRVPIPAGLLVREARLDGKLVSLVPSAGGKAGGQLSALLSHPGRSVLLLDIALPVASSTGEESISLPATASGVTPALRKIDRTRAYAYCRYGPVFPSNVTICSALNT